MTLVSFKNFLTESSASVKAPLGNNDNGMMMELTHGMSHPGHKTHRHHDMHPLEIPTHHFPERPGEANPGEHAQKTALNLFNKLPGRTVAQRMVHWNKYLQRGQDQRNATHAHLEKEGHIKKGEKVKTYWAANGAKSIKHLTGGADSGEDNPSDLVYHVGSGKNRRHIGISQKDMVGRRPTKEANLAWSNVDKRLGTKTAASQKAMEENAHNAALAHGHDTRSMTKAQAHETAKLPHVKKAYKEQNDIELRSSIHSVRKKMSKLSSKELAGHVRGMVGGTTSKMPVYQVASYGPLGDKKTEHEVKHPAGHIEQILKDHGNHLYVDASNSTSTNIHIRTNKPGHEGKVVMQMNGKLWHGSPHKGGGFGITLNPNLGKPSRAPKASAPVGTKKGRTVKAAPTKRTPVKKKTK